MSTSDLARCRKGTDGKEVCTQVSAQDALADAWHHHLVWILVLPLLFLLLPLTHRLVVWVRRRLGHDV